MPMREVDPKKYFEKKMKPGELRSLISHNVELGNSLELSNIAKNFLERQRTDLRKRDPKFKEGVNRTLKEIKEAIDGSPLSEDVKQELIEEARRDLEEHGETSILGKVIQKLMEQAQQREEEE